VEYAPNIQGTKRVGIPAGSRRCRGHEGETPGTRRGKAGRPGRNRGASQPPPDRVAERFGVERSSPPTPGKSQRWYRSPPSPSPKKSERGKGVPEGRGMG